jgi:hypothetical protein
MKFSTLLSFLAHTYVYPGRLCIKAGKDTDFRLEARDIPEKLGAERKSVSNTLCLPDQDIAKFCKIAKQWYETNEENLRGRYLYRNSLGEENTYTTERFLWIFQALEGAIPKKGYTLLEETELQQVIKAATNALPEDPRAAAVAGKLRSSNSGSLPYILKQELPKLFASAGVEASFDIATFVDRIYRRRSKSAHGGAHLDDEQHGVTLIEDTLLLTAIYLVRECAVLGMDAREALRKLGSALWYDAIPLK